MVLNKSIKTYRYGFFLTDEFSLIAYSSAIETLRMANNVAGTNLYSWENISLHGKVIRASCGMKFNTLPASEISNEFDAIFICGGIAIEKSWTVELGKWLNRIAKQRLVLGSISTGSYLLAKAGLLDGYQCTIHWDRFTSTAEEFPHIQLTLDMFHFDRDRYTCAGGSAVLDFFLELIKNQHGKEVTDQICDILLLDRHRDKFDRQRVPLRRQIGTSQPKLTEAAELMQANIEEPLKPDELAAFVHISRRQLERLFKRYLKCTPTKYYLNLRLNAARRLLLQSNKSITDIAICCGFTSTTHFSKCYRQLFGVSPRHDRQLRAS